MENAPNSSCILKNKFWYFVSLSETSVIMSPKTALLKKKILISESSLLQKMKKIVKVNWCNAVQGSDGGWIRSVGEGCFAPLDTPGCLELPAGQLFCSPLWMLPRYSASYCIGISPTFKGIDLEGGEEGGWSCSIPVTTHRCRHTSKHLNSDYMIAWERCLQQT